MNMGEGLLISASAASGGGSSGAGIVLGPSFSKPGSTSAYTCNTTNALFALIRFGDMQLGNWRMNPYYIGYWYLAAVGDNGPVDIPVVIYSGTTITSQTTLPMLRISLSSTQLGMTAYGEYSGTYFSAFGRIFCTP